MRSVRLYEHVTAGAIPIIAVECGLKPYNISDMSLQISSLEGPPSALSSEEHIVLQKGS